MFPNTYETLSQLTLTLNPDRRPGRTQSEIRMRIKRAIRSV